MAYFFPPNCLFALIYQWFGTPKNHPVVFCKNLYGAKRRENTRKQTSYKKKHNYDLHSKHTPLQVTFHLPVHELALALILKIVVFQLFCLNLATLNNVNCRGLALTINSRGPATALFFGGANFCLPCFTKEMPPPKYPLFSVVVFLVLLFEFQLYKYGHFPSACA